MMKFLSLGFVLAAATFGSDCFSYSSTTRAVPAPAPAPAPVVQRTVYPMVLTWTSPSNLSLASGWIVGFAERCNAGRPPAVLALCRP